MKVISQIDWARLAAYIDGEGSIDIHKGKHTTNQSENFYVRVHVTNTDPRLTEWCKENFGGSIHVSRQRSQKLKKCFQWMVASKSAHLVLSGCLPYFLIKREQAEVALAFQRTVARVGRRKHPPEVIELRRQYKQRLSAMKDIGNRYSNAELVPTQHVN